MNHGGRAGPPLPHGHEGRRDAGSAVGSSLQDPHFAGSRIALVRATAIKDKTVGNVSPATLLSQLKTSQAGLTTEEARRRLAETGPNDPTPKSHRGILV